MKTQSKRWFSSLFATVVLVTAIGFNTAIGANINSKTAVNNSLEGSTVDSGNNLLKTAAQSTLNRNAKSGFEYNGVTYKNRYERTLAEDGFIYGVVQPWSGRAPGQSGSNGGDFGDNIFLGTKCSFDVEVMRETLTNCKAMGLNCVKTWLTKGGGGFEFDKYGNTVIRQKVLDNLETYLQIAKELDIGICVTIFPHIDFSVHNYGKDNYDIATQHAFDPEKRKGTMDNIVKPVCEVIKKYEDTVTMVEVYCEPEGDVYDEADKSTKAYGTTWDNMIDFIVECKDTIHSVMPNMPVTTASGGGDWDKLRDGTFNKMELDIIGNDVYNDDGNVADLSELKLNAPCILGESGAGTKNNWSDEFQIKVVRAFYENAKAGGYVGAFAWHYGYKADNLEALTFVNPQGELRPVASAIHFMTLDNRYERTGETPLIDKPVFLGGTDFRKIRFYGARTADRYEIYRSDDGRNWKLFNTWDAYEIDNGYYICSFEDTTGEVGKTYYYKVKAISDMDETSVYSDSSHGFFVTEITCAPEDNIIKNHDFSDSFNGWDFWNNGGSQFSVETVTDKYFGNTPKTVAKITGSGNYDALIQKGVKLKNKTKYTFTFTAKGIDTPNLDGGCTVKVECYDAKGSTNLLGSQIDIDKSGEWYTFSITFKTGDYNVDGGSTVYFGEHFGEFYITDLYLFETPLPPTK